MLWNKQTLTISTSELNTALQIFSLNNYVYGLLEPDLKRLLLSS
jgi:hypothetical protein